MLNRWNAVRQVKPGAGFDERTDDAWWRAAPEKVITGTPDNDTLRGSQGDDTIDGAAGADRMIGRGGNDSYVVDNAGDSVRELAGEGNDTVIASIDWTLGKNVENLSLYGGLANLNGTGNNLNNLISDNSGSNLLSGLGGNDTLNGGHVISPGYADTLFGGGGHDTLTAGLHDYSHDELHGGAGNDSLSVQAGSNWLYGDEGNDLLDSGGGGLYHQDADRLFGGIGRDTLQGGMVQDGGEGDDVLKANNTRLALGGDGNDKITGLAGGGYDDGRVDGGSGDDKIDVTAPLNDLFVLGGEGNDTASGAASQGQLQIDGGAGHDTVWGYQLGAGNDMTLAGGDGNDTVSGIASNSATLSGGEGDDRVSFTGSGFSFGHVSGDAGNDTLSASHGMDTLAGGVGDDLFLLSAKEILWQDMIYTADFESGHDRLSVSQSTLAVGDGDLQVDGAVTIDGSGGFDAGAELVIVAADIFGDLTLDKAAAAIGNATQDYVAGQSVVFMVDNGVDSWALHFTSAGADATVSASELSVIARLTGTSSTGAEDVVWGT